MYNLYRAAIIWICVPIFGESKFRSPFRWKINLPICHATSVDFFWPTKLCFLRSVPDPCYVDLLKTDQPMRRPTTRPNDQPTNLTNQPTDRPTNWPTDRPTNHLECLRKDKFENKLVNLRVVLVRRLANSPRAKVTNLDLLCPPKKNNTTSVVRDSHLFLVCILYLQ